MSVILLSLLLLLRLNALYITFTPRNLKTQSNRSSISIILGNFDITEQSIAQVHQLFLYEEYRFASLYNIPESKQRRKKLLEYIDNTKYHSTLFSLPKLTSNPRLANAIFGRKLPRYAANLLARWRSIHDTRYVYDQNCRKVYRKLVNYAVEKHMDQMESYSLFDDYLWDMNDKDRIWLFKKLTRRNLMPEIMAAFLRAFARPKNPGDSWNLSGPGESLASYYLNLKTCIPDDQWNVHILLLHFAIKSANIPGLYIFMILPIELHSKLAILKNPNEWFEELKCVESEAKDRAYWSVLATILFNHLGERVQNRNIYSISSWLLRNSVPQFLPPVLAKPLIEKLLLTWVDYDYYGHFTFNRIVFREKTLRDLFLVLESIPTCHLPPRFKDFSTRRTMWLRDGPFVSVLRDFVDLVPDDDHQQGTAAILEELVLRQGLVPLGLLINYDKSIERKLFSEIAHESAVKSLSSKVLDRGKLSTIMTVWPYLISECRQLDLSIFFPKTIVTTKWNDWKAELGEMGDLALHFLHRLDITSYFTPFELRKMISQA